MPIAIFRMNRLSVAMLRHVDNPVRNFSPRQIRDLRMTFRINDQAHRVQVFFTKTERRRGLLKHIDEDWDFQSNHYRTIRRELRNGKLTKESVHDLPRLSSAVWTQDCTQLPWVFGKFEEEQSARCIIEQYLHQHSPNPLDYNVVTFDFNLPRLDNAPFCNMNTVRTLEEVQAAILSDRSETADVWLQLLMDEPDTCPISSTSTTTN